MGFLNNKKNIKIEISVASKIKTTLSASKIKSSQTSKKKKNAVYFVAFFKQHTNNSSSAQNNSLFNWVFPEDTNLRITTKILPLFANKTNSKSSQISKRFHISMWVFHQNQNQSLLFLLSTAYSAQEEKFRKFLSGFVSNQSPFHKYYQNKFSKHKIYSYIPVKKTVGSWVIYPTKLQIRKGKRLSSRNELVMSTRAPCFSGLFSPKSHQKEDGF